MLLITLSIQSVRIIKYLPSNADFASGLLQGETLAPYLYIIVLDYVVRNLDQNKNLGFTLREQLSRRYPAEMLTGADFADYLVR